MGEGAIVSDICNFSGLCFSGPLCSVQLGDALRPTLTETIARRMHSAKTTFLRVKFCISLLP